MHEEPRKEREDKVVSSHDLKSELAALPKQKGFSSGYPSLDYYIREFREGDLVIISGLTGEGKTQFGISLSKRFIEQDVTPMWFSYEISSQELLERFGTSLPVFYLPRLMTSKAPDWIEAKIVEAKEKYGAKAVFIDHLHYLTDESAIRNRNLSELLGNLCRQFKMLARKHKVMVFLLCHIRKVKADKERPTIDDLKDSSGIAQEADTVLIVQRKGHKRGKKDQEDGNIYISTDIKLWIDKNRRTGMLGAVNMYFNPDVMMHLEAGEVVEKDTDVLTAEELAAMRE